MRLLILVLLTLLLPACGPGPMPVLRDQVTMRWMDVKAQYEDRAGLAPVLSAVLREYAGGQGDVLAEIADARRAALHFQMGPDPSRDPQGFVRYAAVQARLENSVGRLLRVVAAYGNLRENPNVVAISAQWQAAAKSIAASRAAYDDAARLYNERVTTLCGRWWARLTGGSAARAPMPLFADLPPPPAAI